MAGMINHDSAGIRAAVTEFEQAEQECNRQKVMTNDVITDLQYTGRAADKFKEKMYQLLTEFGRVNKALNGLHVTLAENVKAYDAQLAQGESTAAGVG
jgi:uncharacterized protein YukE